MLIQGNNFTATINNSTGKNISWAKNKDTRPVREIKSQDEIYSSLSKNFRSILKQIQRIYYVFAVKFLQMLHKLLPNGKIPAWS